MPGTIEVMFFNVFIGFFPSEYSSIYELQYVDPFHQIAANVSRSSKPVTEFISINTHVSGTIPLILFLNNVIHQNE